MDDEFLGEDLDDGNAQSLAAYARFAEDPAADADDSDFSIASIESMQPRLVNIVASAEFNVEFDLFNIASRARNAEYNPRRFQAVILRIQEPRATALVFRTGKMNLVGLKTEDNARVAAHKFGRIVKLLGYPNLRLKSFQISNMVATIGCNFPVRLEALTSHPGHRQFAKYNPELFAGAIYKIPEPRVTLLIFASGKIVMTGAKNREMLLQAAEYVYPILQLFQKVNIEPKFDPIIPQPQEEKPKAKPPPKKPIDPFADVFKTRQKRT
jgi:transcription initiation factor TFIID TATA-box-binding protein